MKYLDLFSGISAPTVAWSSLGWSAIAYAEIDMFASAVLYHHYPDTPNLGDVTLIDWDLLKNKADILIGGSPCQSFSMAGQRQSLDDERGNLALKFCHIANTTNPIFTIYENVPGILSAKHNPFGKLLSLLVGAELPLTSPIGGHKWESSGFVVGSRRSVAWRTLCASYFGVPQRRRRVFVVAYDYRAGSRLFGEKPNCDIKRLAGIPGAILFEPDSVPGNHATGVKSEQNTSKSTGSRAEESSRRLRDAIAIPDQKSSKLKNPTKSRVNREPLSTDPTKSRVNREPLSIDPTKSRDGEKYQTPNAQYPMSNDGRCFNALNPSTAQPNLCPMTPGATTFVTSATHCQIYAQCPMPNAQCPMPNAQYPMPNAQCPMPIAFSCVDHGQDCALISPTLRSLSGSRLNGGGQVAIAYNVTLCDTNGKRKDRPNGGIYVNQTEISSTATCGGAESTAIVFRADNTKANGIGVYTDNKTDNLSTLSGEGVISANVPPRKLTPVECLRLQGFPDDYLDILYNQKPAAKSRKYQAIGNSMAVPVVRWIGERIEKVVSILLSSHQEC